MADPIRKILVPLDGSKNSERGLSKAVYIAKEHEATLDFVYVMHKSPRKEKSARKEKSMRSEIPTFMVKAEMLAKKNGIPSTSRVLTGDSGHEIVEFADTRNIDLIVIGARGLSGFKKIFLGSVSSYVMQKAKTAVMLVK